MNIVMIGTGHVAHVLGQQIILCGHHIVQVAGRNPDRTRQLAVLLNAEAINDYRRLSDTADLYIIAVSDHALEELCSWFPRQDRGIVVHTAGAVGMQVLSGITARYGVLYPLQSLRSNLPDIPEIPILIDANSSDTLQMVRSFAVSLSGKVVQADDQTRLKLHLSAVIANNFSNHLFTLVQDYCIKEKLDFSLLLPLLLETIQRLEHAPAYALQTGPAVRNDLYTLEKHASLLTHYPGLLKIYHELSASISRYHQQLRTD